MNEPICTVVKAAVDIHNGQRSLRIQLHEGKVWRFEFPDTVAAQKIGQALDRGTCAVVTMKGDNDAH